MNIFNISFVFFMTFFFICGITDMKYKKIYNLCVYPMAILGLILKFNSSDNLKALLFGSIFIFLFYFLISFFGLMGMGDIKLLIVVGLGFGLLHSVVIFFFGNLLAFVYIFSKDFIFGKIVAQRSLEDLKKKENSLNIQYPMAMFFFVAQVIVLFYFYI